MRADDAVTDQEEKRVIFRARVRRSFDGAHRCLTLARLARLKGDNAQASRWIWVAGLLRASAARWRRKAQGVAPTCGRTG